jgi:hypothetical protein
MEKPVAEYSLRMRPTQSSGLAVFNESAPDI